MRSNPKRWRLLVAGAVLLGISPAHAAGDRVTLFLDGARIEVTAVAKKGTATVALPPAMVPGSLRVKPAGRTVIDRVTVVPPPAAKDAERERLALEERRDALQDRLAALGVKEEVFKAAAKSQSGRAPKRTKTNPEPLATIRQGTDYAVAQLESVYRGRRLAERELAKVTRRLATLSGDPAAVGSLARISVHGGEQLQLSYLVADRKWIPSYELRLLPGGEGQLTLRTESAATAVVPKTMAIPSNSELPVGEHGMVVKQACTINRALVSSGAQETVSVELTCSGSTPLPSGPAACYYHGRYLGMVHLPGITPGVPLALVCGTFTGSVAPVAGQTKNE